jgi:predicted nucleotidyltransferase
VVLFGSHARGEGRADSDVDLLLVLPEVEHKRKTTAAALSVLRDMPVCKDVVVTTPEEISRRHSLTTSVLRYALRDGKVVYERDLRPGEGEPSGSRRAREARTAPASTARAAHLPSCYAGCLPANRT